MTIEMLCNAVKTCVTGDREHCVLICPYYRENNCRKALMAELEEAILKPSETEKTASGNESGYMAEYDGAQLEAFTNDVWKIYNRMTEEQKQAWALASAVCRLGIFL